MACQIRLRRTAYADIDEHFAFIAARSGPASAARWRDRLIARLDGLADHPGRYPPADEAAGLGVDLRVMLFGRRRHVYRVLFTIDGDTVNVHRVRHAAQDRLSRDEV